MTVAIVAGLVSITGGIYSLRANLFQNQSSYGELVGFVRDERLAKPLRMATVELRDADGSLLGTLSTDENGRYSMKELKEGEYELRASAVFHESEERFITIRKNQTTTIYFDLTPLPDEKPQIVPQPISLQPLETSYPQGAAYPEAPSVPRMALQPSQGAPYETPNPQGWRAPQVQNPAPARSGAKEVLVQTGVQLLEQWMQKKQQAKETSQETVADTESSSAS